MIKVLVVVSVNAVFVRHYKQCLSLFYWWRKLLYQGKYNIINFLEPRQTISHKVENSSLDIALVLTKLNMQSHDTILVENVFQEKI